MAYKDKRGYNCDVLNIGILSLDEWEYFRRNHSKHEQTEKVKKTPLTIHNGENVQPMKINSQPVQSKEKKEENIPNVVKDPLLFQQGKLAVKRIKLATPKAYRFRNIYKVKKEQLVAKEVEEDKKKRQFQSRPMPNFNALHQKLSERPVVHHVTYPVTPETLKISRVQESKRKERLEKLRLERDAAINEPKPMKNVRSLNYLKDRPFIPKKAQTVIDIKPFHFCTEQRVKQRNLFNVATTKLLENKKKRETEERLARELEERKMARQMTQFKARLNPFKVNPILENIPKDNPFLGLFDA